MKLSTANRTLAIRGWWFRLQKVSGGYVFRPTPYGLTSKYRLLDDAWKSFEQWEKERNEYRASLVD